MDINLLKVKNSSFLRRFQSELLTVSKAVKSPLYRYDSGEGNQQQQPAVRVPEAQQHPATEELDGDDWGFASAFLFALSLITTVGKELYS